jgi:hypothetical protein
LINPRVSGDPRDGKIGPFSLQPGKKPQTADLFANSLMLTLNFWRPEEENAMEI